RLVQTGSPLLPYTRPALDQQYLLAGYLALQVSKSAVSAMARMSAVAVLLLVLLVALLAATIALVTMIVPFHRDASHAITTEDVPHDIDQQQASQQFPLPSPSESPANATAAVAYGPLTHAYAESPALNVTSHGLHTLLLAFMLYAAITTLGTLLWWMDVTHTHVKAWMHQQGLAVMNRWLKLKSASKCFVRRGVVALLYSPMVCACWVMQRASEAVRTVMVSLAGTHELKEAMEMRMQALGMQLEERMREVEEAERRRVSESREMGGQAEERERGLAAELAAVKAELAGVKGELAEHKGAMTQQWDMAERRRDTDLRDLREETRKGEDAMRAELAKGREERRREVEGLKWPRAMEELTACKEWRKIQDLKMNVELEIRQSEGDQKIAWE
ncbi:unnamed protein product, partial [Closterium sp. Naga37s-1]